MKRNLLLELLWNINHNEKLSEKISKAFKTNKTKGYEELLKLTDEQIEDILKQETTELKFLKIYMDLKANTIPENIKQLVQTKLEECPKKLDMIISMLESSSLLRRTDAYNFFELVFETDYNIAECVVDASTDEALLSRADAIEFVKVLANSETDQGYYVRDCVIDEGLLAHKDALEIVKIVANAEDEEHIEYACRAACDCYVLDMENAIEVVRLFANAENPDLLETATELFSDSICERKDALEFFKIALNAKGDRQVEEVTRLVFQTQILDNDNVLEILKLIANTPNERNVGYGRSTIENLYKNPTIDILEIVKLVLDAKGHNQARAASIISGNDTLMLREDAIEFIKLAANSDNESNATNLAFTLKNEKLLQHKDLFSVAEIIIGTKHGFWTGKYVREVALNEILQQSPIYLNVLQMIASADKEYQAQTATEVACNPNINISIREDALQIINAFVTSEGEFQSKYAKLLIEEYPTIVSLTDITDITTCKNTQNISREKFVKNKLFAQKSTMHQKNEPLNFGIKEVLSQGNVDIAIQLLKQTRIQEITEDTVVKVKKHKK